MIGQSKKQFLYEYKLLLLSFTFIGEKGKTLGQKKWDKVRRYSKHIKKLDNITWWKINANIWEQATNMLGTHK
jgi:hypothetical protein